MPRKNWARAIDWPLVLLYATLVLLGWINIYAAVYSEEHRSIFDLTQRYGLQMLWIVASFVLAAVVLMVDSRFFYVFAYYIFGLLLLVLCLVLVFGTEIHNSRSWLTIGPLRLQPSEFAKFATALALAKLMGGNTFRPESLRSWIFAFLFLSLPVGLIVLQNDYGSSLTYAAFLLVFYRRGFSPQLLMFGLFLVVLFLLALMLNQVYIVLGLGVLALLLYAGITRSLKGVVRLAGMLAGVLALLFLANGWFELGLPIYVVCLVPTCIGAVVGIVHGLWNKRRAAWLLSLMLVACIGASYSVDYVFDNILEEHHQRRINDMLGIEDDPLGWGYNVNQSKIAIGSGGFAGKGFLQGTQTKFNFVPEQSTDFIFCTVGEEWGFLGSTVVVGLFLALLLRIVQVAERQKMLFHKLYGYGVAAILFVHVAINVSMTIGLFPVVGIPLPFFSYGGSSLLAFTLLLFILIKFDSARVR